MPTLLAIQTRLHNLIQISYVALKSYHTQFLERNEAHPQFQSIHTNTRTRRIIM